MTITNGYCTEADLSETVSSDGTKDGLAGQHRSAGAVKIEVASRAIDTYIGDRFWLDPTDTTRQYGPDAVSYDRTRGVWTCRVGWCADVTTVEIDSGDTGTYTEVESSDYLTVPLDGARAGLTGWPVEEIVFYNSSLRCTGVRPVVKVTGAHGWAATPPQVREACIIASRDLIQNRNVNFAMVATEYGAMRIRGNSEVARLIDVFRRDGGTGLPGIA